MKVWNPATDGETEYDGPVEIGARYMLNDPFTDSPPQLIEVIGVEPTERVYSIWFELIMSTREALIHTEWGGSLTGSMYEDMFLERAQKVVNDAT